jgi:hypothetical protein
MQIKVQLCCPALPCFFPCTCAIICCSLVAHALQQQHHQVSVGVACIWWSVSMKLAACGTCQQLLQTLMQNYLLVPWKRWLHSELAQQHGSVYESIDCASWVITCCTCPPSSALLGRAGSHLPEQCHGAYFEHFHNTRQPLQHHPACSCVLHATLLSCCKLLCLILC